MRVADICTHHVVCINAEMSVRAAAQAMRKHHVGTLVVTEQPNGERVPVGIVTDRDLVLAVVAPNVDAEAVTVGDVMTPDVATCRSGEELFDALETMRERGVRRLPVLNAEGGLVGLLAADDVFSAIGEHMHELGRAMTREQVREMELRT